LGWGIARLARPPAPAGHSHAYWEWGVLFSGELGWLILHSTQRTGIRGQAGKQGASSSCDKTRSESRVPLRFSNGIKYTLVLNQFSRFAMGIIIESNRIESNQVKSAAAQQVNLLRRPKQYRCLTSSRICVQPISAFASCGHARRTSHIYPWCACGAMVLWLLTISTCGYFREFNVTSENTGR